MKEPSRTPRSKLTEHEKIVKDFHRTMNLLGKISIPINSGPGRFLNDKHRQGMALLIKAIGILSDVQYELEHPEKSTQEKDLHECFDSSNLTTFNEIKELIIKTYNDREVYFFTIAGDLLKVLKQEDDRISEGDCLVYERDKRRLYTIREYRS